MIPNLIKGSGITGAIRYAMGEGNDAETGKRREREPGQGTRTEILGGQNFPFEIDSPERVELARRLMEYQALPENQGSKTRKCENDCLHLSLSWNPGETPSRAEMIEAATGSLKALGLEGARAVFFAHNDTDHRHLHIVASRIDPETGKTFAEQKGDFKLVQEWALQWEKEHDQIAPARARIHNIREAVQAGDRTALLDLLTANDPTFTGRELNKAIGYGGLAKPEADAFHQAVVADPEVIALRDEILVDGRPKAVPRFTTRAVLAEERAVLASAGSLNTRTGFDLADATRDRAAAPYTLTAEQRAALDHVTGDNGLALIVGEAGTGKSQTLKGVRAAYEAEDFTVIGMAWTNKVVLDMRADGFAQAGTLASQLDTYGHCRPGEKPCDRWDARTVLMVDEAAQLSTGALGVLLNTADVKGAKVILVGDDRQFSSIDRGGLFTLLRRDELAGGYGAAEITEVQRVKDVDQRAAWQQMHKGDFAPALTVFERQGMLTWSKAQQGAMDALITRYGADMAADPGKDRFIFAATNDEVRTLNEKARQLAKESGQLGEQKTLAATAAGPLEIATGDRIQLNVNGRTRTEKAAGLVKDAVGTIVALEANEQGKPVMTLRFDAAKGKDAKEASVVIGEDREAGEINQFSRGYAGTSYKGQGRSIDQTYVLHSSHWQASASYVSLTRHKESVALFVSQESVTEAQPWMTEIGGLDALKGAHRSSAREAYAAWAEAKPGLAARHDLAGYVGYVQEQWAGQRAGATDLERLARMMGRDDTKHAASGYEIAASSLVQSGLAKAEIFDRQKQPDAPPREAEIVPSAGRTPATDDRTPAVPAVVLAPAEGLSVPLAPVHAEGRLPDEPFVDPNARRSFEDAGSEAEASAEEFGMPIGAQAVAMGEYGLTVAAELAGEAGEKLLDFVSRLTDSFTGAPARKYGAAELARDPGARRENYAQQARSRDSDEAIDRIRLDLEAGRRLQPADVRSLTIDHLLQIKAHGDDYVRQMVWDREREQARSFGRDRDR